MSAVTSAGIGKKLVMALSLLMAIVFAIFAYLQVNDATQYGNHDAWLWILMYGAMAVFSGCMAFQKMKKGILLSWMGFCWGCLLFKIQDEHGNIQLDWLRMDAYWAPESQQMVQQVNESGGLFILASYATVSIFMDLYLKKTSLH
ncbi:hypothetical protein TDB9533_03653 [Thalassocella blandensis]|nr:hypothetical protein TDB9533_03653 [Thalassocella blandensis]